VWRWTSGGKHSQRGIVAGGWNKVSWLAWGDFARLGIRTPCAGWTRVPPLYHFADDARAARAKEFLQRSQSLTACKWKRRQTNQANNTRIKHPLRNLQQALV